jgi:FG-GAP repeat
LDFDADGFGDVAVGVPGDSVGDKPRAGQVVVLYGFASGFNFVRSELWNQDRKGILDKARPREAFGGNLGKGHH